MKHDTRRPTSIRLAGHFSSELKKSEDQAGWVFESAAQFFNEVNDHLLLFRVGSAAQTIAQRVADGRVKIHDGHPFDLGVATTLGRVLSAEERPEALVSQNFLSKSSEQAADRINDETIDEVSMELFILPPSRSLAVNIADVPDVARPFATINENDQALVTEVLAFRWEALGLVSSSSQAKRAIFEPPVLVEFQDLAVRAGDWDPVAAAETLAIWKSTRTVRGNPPKMLEHAFLGAFQGPDGKRIFAGPIASVDDHGHLVVSAAALGPAVHDLGEKLKAAGIGDEPRQAAVASALKVCGRYMQNAELLTVSAPAGTTESTTEESATAETPEANIPAGPATPPTGSDEEVASKLATRIAHLGLRRKIQSLHREVTTFESTGTSRRPAGRRARARSAAAEAQ